MQNTQQLPISEPTKVSSTKYRVLGLLFFVIIFATTLMVYRQTRPPIIEEMSRTELLDSAINEFDRAIELSPDSVAGYRFLSEAYTEKGELELAELTWRHAAEQNPDKGWPLVELAVHIIERQQIEEAYEFAQQGFVLSPNDLAVHAALIRLYRHRHGASLPIELISNAIGHLEMTLSSSPDVNPQFLQTLNRYDILLGNLVSEYQTRGDSYAEEQLNAAWLSEPNSLAISSRMAQHLVSNGKEQEATSVFETVLEIDPDNPRALRGLAQISYHIQNNCKDALRYQQSLVSEANPPLAEFVQLSDFGWRCRNNPIAVEAFRDADAIFPEGRLQAYLTLINQYGESEDIELTVNALESLTEETGNSTFRSLLVANLRTLGQCPEMLFHQGQLATESQRAGAFTALGFLAQSECDDTELAIEAFEKAISIDPNLPSPYYQLAQLYKNDLPVRLDYLQETVIASATLEEREVEWAMDAIQRIDPEGTVRGCEIASEFHEAYLERSGTARDYLLLGNIYSGVCNQPELAVQTYEAGSAMLPEAAIFYYKAGLAYAEAGDFEKALEQMEIALATDVDGTPALAVVGAGKAAEWQNAAACNQKSPEEFARLREEQSAENHLAVGYVYFLDCAMPGLAASHFEKALKLSEDSIEAKFWLSNAVQAGGDEAYALELRKDLVLNNLASDILLIDSAYTSLTEMLETETCSERASFYQDLLQPNSKETYLYDAGEFFLEACPNRTLATQALDLALQKENADEPQLLLASSYLESGEDEKAVEILITLADVAAEETLIVQDTQSLPITSELQSPSEAEPSTDDLSLVQVPEEIEDASDSSEPVSVAEAQPLPSSSEPELAFEPEPSTNTLPPEEATENTFDGPGLVPTVAELKVRARPNTSAEVLAVWQLEQGPRRAIARLSDNSWIKIEYSQDVFGWVFAELTDLDSPIFSLPISFEP